MQVKALLLRMNIADVSAARAGGVSFMAAVILVLWSQRFGVYPIALWLAFMALTALSLVWCATRAHAPTAMQVIGWAFLLRIVAMWGTPYYEDDYFRYLWDGYRTLMDGNPYPFSPSHFFC